MSEPEKCGWGLRQQAIHDKTAALCFDRLYQSFPYLETERHEDRRNHLKERLESIYKFIVLY